MFGEEQRVCHGRGRGHLGEQLAAGRAGEVRAAAGQPPPRRRRVGPRATAYEGKTPVRWSKDATWFQQCCCDTRRAKTADCMGDLRYFIESQAAG